MAHTINLHHQRGGQRTIATRGGQGATRSTTSPLLATSKLSMVTSTLGVRSPAEALSVALSPSASVVSASAVMP
ncbi:MAG: hypothetical protein R3E57_03685 [Porticoccaceae bacterium]